MAGPLHRSGQVLQQVPAVGHFEGVGNGFPDGAGIGGGRVAADDLGAGMFGQPAANVFAVRSGSTSTTRPASTSTRIVS